jgi:hypothetical protein
MISATALVALIAILSLSGLALQAHANTPVSVTYYYKPPSITNFACTDGKTGTLDTVPGGGVTLMVDNCDEFVVNGVYNGPTFVVTSVTFTIHICYSDPTQKGYGLQIIGPIAGFDLPLPSCSVSTSIVDTEPASTQLMNNDPLTSSVNLYPGTSNNFASVVPFSGSVEFSGYILSTVPEFPLGLVALLAVALPLVIMLRAKQSARVSS